MDQPTLFEMPENFLSEEHTKRVLARIIFLADRVNFKEPADAFQAATKISHDIRCKVLTAMRISKDLIDTQIHEGVAMVSPTGVFGVVGPKVIHCITQMTPDEKVALNFQLRNTKTPGDVLATFKDLGWEEA